MPRYHLYSFSLRGKPREETNLNSNLEPPRSVSPRSPTASVTWLSISLYVSVHAVRMPQNCWQLSSSLPVLGGGPKCSARRINCAKLCFWDMCGVEVPLRLKKKKMLILVWPLKCNRGLPRRRWPWRAEVMAPCMHPQLELKRSRKCTWEAINIPQSHLKHHKHHPLRHCWRKRFNTSAPSLLSTLHTVQGNKSCIQCRAIRAAYSAGQ